jgi:GTP-binding protein Era
MSEPETSGTKPGFRSGFVGLAGAPNAGKSTLLNRLVGQKVAIVSRRPQTTRHRVGGIVTEPGFQLILVDTPGILATEDSFNRSLVAVAEESLKGCDLIVHLRSPDTAGGEDEQRVIDSLRAIGRPVIEVWNKMDLEGEQAPEIATGIDYAASFKISALTGMGIEKLKEELAARLPEGPLLYPEDDVSDRDLRFLAPEIVREKIFSLLKQEVPYGIATWTEEWEDRPEGKTYVRVVIQTEREAHKQIIIGEGGAMIKKIGQMARPEIEELSGGSVFLDLWVKVKPKWRKDASELERLGLKPRDTS